MLSEALPEHVQQARVVRRLLLLHLVEHRCGCRVAFAETIRKLAIDAAVFFLERDGECEDFRFGQIAKVLRHVR